MPGQCDLTERRTGRSALLDALEWPSDGPVNCRTDNARLDIHDCPDLADTHEQSRRSSESPTIWAVRLWRPHVVHVMSVCSGTSSLIRQ